MHRNTHMHTCAHMCTQSCSTWAKEAFCSTGSKGLLSLYPCAPSTNTEWTPARVRLWVRPRKQSRPHSQNSHSSKKKNQCLLK